MRTSRDRILFLFGTFFLFAFCGVTYAEPLTLAAATILGAGIAGVTSLIGSGISWWSNSAAQDRQETDQDQGLDGREG